MNKFLLLLVIVVVLVVFLVAAFYYFKFKRCDADAMTAKLRQGYSHMKKVWNGQR